MTPAGGGGGGSSSRPGPPHNAAVIDVGSNSVLLLHVAVEPGARHREVPRSGDGVRGHRKRAAREAGEHWTVRVVDEGLAITRLGAGLVAGGRLDPAARARTHAAVVDFAKRARDAGATSVWAFATGAARAASDGAEFARELEGSAGLPVEIVSGVREARLSYAAVGRGLGVSGPLLAIDIGGRTTELTLGEGERIDAAVSLELGALALTDAHLRGDPPTSAELSAAAETAATVLRTSDLPARARACGGRLAASGGTATALAALDLGLAAYDAKRVHGHVLAYDSLRALATRLAAMPLAERMALRALDPGRAAILPAGALVLERVAAAASAGEVCVSDHGVRHGYLRERLLEAGLDVTY